MSSLESRRRRHARRRCFVPAALEDSWRDVDCVILDIGEGGARLGTLGPRAGSRRETLPPPGDRVRLTVWLPDEHPLEMPSWVIWCSERTTLGVEFFARLPGQLVDQLLGHPQPVSSYYEELGGEG